MPLLENILNISQNKVCCIYTVKLWNIMTISSVSSLCEYVLNCNLFLWSKLYFKHHYCSLPCHMIFRNHYYYQCWKQSCCTIFLWKPWDFIFQDSQKVQKNSIYLKSKSFFHIINVFTATFEPLLINLMLPWWFKVLNIYLFIFLIQKVLNGSPNKCINKKSKWFYILWAELYSIQSFI